MRHYRDEAQSIYKKEESLARRDKTMSRINNFHDQHSHDKNIRHAQHSDETLKKLGAGNPYKGEA